MSQKTSDLLLTGRAAKVLDPSLGRLDLILDPSDDSGRSR